MNRPNLCVFAEHAGERIVISPRPTDREIKEAARVQHDLRVQNPPDATWTLTGDYRVPCAGEYYWYWCGGIHVPTVGGTRWTRRGKIVRCDGRATHRFHIIERVPEACVTGEPSVVVAHIVSLEERVRQVELELGALARKPPQAPEGGWTYERVAEDG